MSGAGYFRSDGSSLNMLLRGFLQRLPLGSETGGARVVRHRCRAIAVSFIILGSVQLAAEPSQPLDPPLESNSTIADEPITPIPEPPPIDPLRVKLGERLFGDPRLSHDNSRSCLSCHDVNTNGASTKQRDMGLDGSSLPFNTLTVFDATLNFRLGWEGKIRTVVSDVKAALENPEIMGVSISELAEKLIADPDMRRDFTAAYGGGPDAKNILDAIASFERTLVTPDSSFDRWLTGDAAALSAEELDGYRLFKSLGCVSCHQGVNIGGNLFERHGIFHPLASPQPEILRVPSLRNVATTPPYFHDGSAQTLDDAVRKMGLAQLNSTLTDQQVKAIVAYLQTLTGKYRGTPVGASP
jgi:cytochrome c peroxidase